MRFVPFKMLRTHLSWLVIGGVAVVLIAAAVDALRPSDSETPPAEGGLAQEREREEQAPEEAPAALVGTETAPLERCTVQQYALRFERLGGTPVLALAHVWGSPCRTPRIPIEVSLFGRALAHVWGSPCRTPRIPIEVSLFGRNGNPVEASVGVQQAFVPTDLSPRIEVIAELQVTYLCGGPKPRRLVAEATPYVVRGWLPRSYGTCLDDLGP